MTVVAAGVVIAVALFGRPSTWFGNSSVDESRHGQVGIGQVVRYAGSPSKSQNGSSTVVVEFSDFQCPYCRSFANTVLPSLEREFVITGRIQWFFKHLPLTSIHPNALRLANLGSCVAVQGDFWSFYREIFKVSAETPDAPVAAAREAAGDDLFESCPVDVPTVQVQADVKEANRIGIRSTPTFLIGRRLDDARMQVLASVSGAQPIERFREVLERVLADSSKHP